MAIAVYFIWGRLILPLLRDSNRYLVLYLTRLGTWLSFQFPIASFLELHLSSQGCRSDTQVCATWRRLSGDSWLDQGWAPDPNWTNHIFSPGDLELRLWPSQFRLVFSRERMESWSWDVLPCCSHMRREASKTGLQEEKEEQVSRELSSFGLTPFPDATSLLLSKILLYLYKAFLLPLG